MQVLPSLALHCACPGTVGSFLLVGDHTIAKYLAVESVLNQPSLFFLIKTSQQWCSQWGWHSGQECKWTTSHHPVTGSSRTSWETAIPGCIDVHWGGHFTAFPWTLHLVEWVFLLPSNKMGNKAKLDSEHSVQSSPDCWKVSSNTSAIDTSGFCYSCSCSSLVWIPGQLESSRWMSSEPFLPESLIH